MATGLLGGSFDPIHHGHLIAAERALEALGLSRVLLVPCARQPLKRQGPVAAPEHRRAMLELAVAGDARFAVGALAIHQPRKVWIKECEIARFRSGVLEYHSSKNGNTKESCALRRRAGGLTCAVGKLTVRTKNCVVLE